MLRAGDRVRISLQLIRADPEEHLWAERYERDIGDVLSVQSEVARAVAAEIRGRLTTTDDEKLTPPKPVAPEVLEAYLKGRHNWRKRTLDGLEKAVACFQQAIEIDPTHAASHAGLAESWAIMGQFRPGFGALAARAKAAARKAVELDPQSRRRPRVAGLRQLLLRLELGPGRGRAASAASSWRPATPTPTTGTGRC